MYSQVFLTIYSFLKYILYKNPFRKNTASNLSVGIFIWLLFYKASVPEKSQGVLTKFECICLIYRYVIIYNQEPAMLATLWTLVVFKSK